MWTAVLTVGPVEVRCRPVAQSRVGIAVNGSSPLPEGNGLL
ncbi:hypothetical protein B0G38_001318 [Arthrobacter sp. VKM Ac-2550]|nr:hypothetical protein [Arthrobacter sp. VKM Ac-2550]